MEQTKRQQLETYLAVRAGQDPEFRDRLLANPKQMVETELGLRFPEGLSVSVHEERLNELHVVLPVDLSVSDDLWPRNKLG
jgi:hypothetical protein